MLTKFFVQMQNKMQNEEGQGLVEYALIISLIAIVVALTLPGLATAISGVFTQIITSL
jgi:pilus assembly protein Flp/PilA